MHLYQVMIPNLHSNITSSFSKTLFQQSLQICSIGLIFILLYDFKDDNITSTKIVINENQIFKHSPSEYMILSNALFQGSLLGYVGFFFIEKTSNFSSTTITNSFFMIFISITMNLNHIYSTIKNLIILGNLFDI